MKVNRLVFVLTSSLFLSGCSLFGGNKAGIQVTTNPQANVTLDGKSLGQTPVLQEDIRSGSYDIKITSSDGSLLPWEGKVTLNPGILTVVDRQLASEANKSHGYALFFEKLTNKTTAEVSVISFPDTVSVTVDGAPVGFTPFKSDSISAGHHTFTLTSPGYQDKVIKARVQAGYRLVINTQLGIQTITPTPTPEATPSGTPTPKTPVDITPLPKQATTSAATKPYVEILPTPDNNHLKVRSENVIGNNIIAIVNTGDKFPYLDVKGSWYQIEYEKGKNGWVSATYAKLVQ